MARSDYRDTHHESTQGTANTGKKGAVHTEPVLKTNTKEIGFHICIVQTKM